MSTGLSGWRPRLGVFLLAIALIELAGWMRGQSSSEMFSLRDLVRTRRSLAVVFEPQSMSLCRHSSDVSCEVLRPIITLDHHWCLPILTIAAAWCLFSTSGRKPFTR